MMAQSLYIYDHGPGPPPRGTIQEAGSDIKLRAVLFGVYEARASSSVELQ